MNTNTARLGIDVGGTFTDVVVIDEYGQRFVEKVPSTPEDQSVGIINGIAQVVRTRGVDVSSLSAFAHGSTVATNALLERKLPRTALIVTKGFRDVLEIGTQLRPNTFDLKSAREEAYVPRQRVFEVAERVDRLGKPITPLTANAVDQVVEQVAASGVAAVAICLLFSFRNPDHERQIADALRERLPEVSVAISSEIAPELKEYPRASTTTVAAALAPLVARYMSGITSRLDDVGVSAPLFVMQSNGGTMTAQEASTNAHRMVLSGPAAGVLAATDLAATPEYANLVTFDMGGTSTDIALVVDGRATVERETTFEGRPLLVPQFAIHTIGSGGGSLASVDESGMVHVGPESAGAQPGPACYGRGGHLPTTTDAQVVLGRIDPARFLGGEMELDVDAARRSICTHVADPLGMSLELAASGILEVADAIMARGVRVVSVNRGHDPRDFWLLPFGGAGPMHALSVGALVDVKGVLVPLNPGTFSAVGLSDSDLKYDFVELVDLNTDSVSGVMLEQILANMIERAALQLEASGASGRKYSRIARMRYAWQDNDLEIVLGENAVNDQVLATAVARFHEQHQFEFGHSDRDERVEIVSLGLEAVGTLDRAPRATPEVSRTHEAQAKTTRRVYFAGQQWVQTPVYERSDLLAGATFSGPAIVEEREATTVVIPGVNGSVDAAGNLVLTYQERG